MENEYINLYRDYNTVELLKIILRPEDYQPEAVSAATQLLETRTVTESERNEAAQYYANIAAQQRQTQDKIDRAKNNVSDLLQPLLQPDGEVSVIRWFNLFLLIVTLQYLWSAYFTVRYLVGFFSYAVNYADEQMIIECLNLLLGAVTLYLLYNRKKWGWILIFGNCIAIFFSALGQIYLLIKYRGVIPMPASHVASYAWQIFFSVAALLYLQRNEVALHFNIDSIQKRKYAERIAAVLLGLVVAFSAFTFFQK